MIKAVFFDAVGTVMTMEVIEKKEHHNEAKDQGLTVHDYVVSFAPKEWALYPEVIEVIDKLKADGYKIALISNFDKKVHEIVDSLGIKNKFDLVISSEEAGAAKPNPRIYQHALKSLDLLPEQAIMIGDSYSCDYQAPKDLGMEAVYLDRSKDDLTILYSVITSEAK